MRLGLYRARVSALLQVRTVAAVLGRDLLTIGGILADDARQCEQLQCSVEIQGGKVHVLEKTGSTRLNLGLAFKRGDILRQHLRNVGTVPTGFGHDVAPGVGVLAKNATVISSGLEQLAGDGRSHLVRGNVVVDRGTTDLTSGPLGNLAGGRVYPSREALLDVRAISANPHHDAFADRDC